MCLFFFKIKKGKEAAKNLNWRYPEVWMSKAQRTR